MTTDKTRATVAVDVLAAMDSATTIAFCYGYSETAESMEAARAAVAELIEAGMALQAASDAVKAAREEFRPVHVPIDVQFTLNRALRSEQERFAAALARVKGESA